MKQNIRKKLIIIIIVLLLSMNITLSINASEVRAQENSNIQDQFSDISARNLVLANSDTGKIIYERNIDEKIYPASITKLMTAILVVENCELNDIVTVSENAVKSVPMGYVNANLQVGEKLTDEHLAKYICEIANVQNVYKILEYNKNSRDEILVKIKQNKKIKNAQIARVLGINKKMVERAK